MNVLALEGLPLAGAYCASKSANRAMLLSLAGEKQGDANIFGFTPGVVCTDLAIRVYSQYADATNVTLEEFVKENTQNPGYSPYDATSALRICSFACNKRVEG